MADAPIKYFAAPGLGIERPCAVLVARDRDRKRIIVIADHQDRLAIALHRDRMFGIVGGDETLPHGIVGHLVAGRNDVFAAAAEHDKRGFLIAAPGRGDQRIDGVLRRFVVLLRERGSRHRK